MLVCSRCFLALRCLEGEEPIEVDVACPECGCCYMQNHAEGSIDPELQQKLKLRDLTKEEFLCVVHGGPLPSDVPCTPENVVKLLLSSPIQAVSAHGVLGSARTVITSITLEGGARIYFGASALGSVVYRIAQRSVV